MKTSQHLTEEQLLAIRQLYIDGKAVSWIAEQFDVSRVSISNKVNTRVGKNGKTWKELREERIDSERTHAQKVLVREQKESLEEVIEIRKDRKLSGNEKDRRKWLRQTIREVDVKLKMPKLKPSEYIALSKYRLELQNELIGRDETIIIGAPEEFPDDI